MAPKASEVPPKASKVPPKASEVPLKASEVPPKASEVPPKASEVPPKASEIRKPIDLRPNLALPWASPSLGVVPSPSKRRSKAWAGEDRFSRRMQAYHRRWQEKMNDRAGLTDSFFGVAASNVDRCAETWFRTTFPTLLKRLPPVAFQGEWKGLLEIRWSEEGRWSLSLLKSSGMRAFDREITTMFRGCAGSLQPPKHLQGKNLSMQLASHATVVRNTRLDQILLPIEERDPATGKLKLGWTWIGKLHFHASTFLHRATILEP